MDEALVTNWNSRVHKNDTIYIVGDLMFRAELSSNEYLDRLKGKKHLIIGNHDKHWMKKTDLQAHFISVEHYMEISDGKRKLVFCHYPMMTWNGAAKGAYLIYGHIHNNQNSAYWPLLRTMENALNAGTDINGYRPVVFDELLENNTLFRNKGNADAN